MEKPMPLLDHFHPPVEEFAPWTSIASTWIVALTKSLNRTLPTSGFRAFADVQLGHMVHANRVLKNSPLPPAYDRAIFG